ncbi:asparaginase [Primorskyibacter sp. S187A]|uniref:asparaginase n=1 Tax=Primorskyibacter sp. S187A TaxID=3415130 RepID=UPI003C7BAFD8
MCNPSPDAPHAKAQPLVDIWRGGRLESQHLGHVAICDAKGLVASWGDPKALVYPRSSAKMIQALPLLTSGVGQTLPKHRLALACASHQGGAIHTDEVTMWLGELGLSPDDLRCGPQAPWDRDAKFAMIRAHGTPGQEHNNCSGKHTGFLMLAQHLGGELEYLEIDHPVQKAVLEAFEEVTQETSPGYGIDGCSAPNHAASMEGMARAMAWFAAAGTRSDVMSRAAAQLVEAMHTHPDYVAGERRACTNLMRAMDGVAIKTGAEGYFVAILPKQGLGVALKIADGATRAAEAAIAHVLVSLGVLDAAAQDYINAPIKNSRGIETGATRPAEGFAP